MADAPAGRGGVAFQESPLESIRTEDVNYLDNDKVIFGLGSSLVIDNPPILAYPMRLDFGYQFQQLEDRDFELTSSRPGVTNPFATKFLPPTYTYTYRYTYM